MQISPLGYAFGRPKISSTVSRMHGGGRTNHQLKSYSCACLSVCLCSNACSCIAGVLSGLCFRRRCRASAQFPAKIPRPGFSLHALTHGGERAHHGPFRCSAEAFLPNPTPAQHAPGRVLLPCGFISIMVTTCAHVTGQSLTGVQRVQLGLCVPKPRPRLGRDSSHKSHSRVLAANAYPRVLAQTLHICLWWDVAACRHPRTQTLNPQPICSRHAFACLLKSCSL